MKIDQATDRQILVDGLGNVVKALDETTSGRRGRHVLDEKMSGVDIATSGLVLFHNGSLDFAGIGRVASNDSGQTLSLSEGMSEDEGAEC